MYAFCPYLIFLMFIVKRKKEDGGVFKNVIMPVLALIATVFMMFVAVYAHGIVPYQAAAANGEFSFPVLFYLIVYIVVMVVGALLYKAKAKKN